MPSPSAILGSLGLSPAECTLFLDALFASLPPEQLGLHRPALDDALAGAPGLDARLAAFYGSPAVALGALWIGARLCLEAGRAGGVDTAAGDSVSLSEARLEHIEPLLEAKLRDVFQAEIAHFDARVRSGAAPTELRTPRALALSYALLGVGCFTHHAMGRIDAARACIAQLGSILRRTGLPPRPSPPERAYGIDDLLLDHHWFEVLWGYLHETMRIAASLDGEAALPVDPLAEFPTAPPYIPVQPLLAAVGTPSLRPANPPLPPHIALLVADFDFDLRSMWGWLDPDLDPPVGPAERGRVLRAIVTNMSTNGSDYIFITMAFAVQQAQNLRAWAAERTGFSLLQLLILESLGPPGTPQGFAGPGEPDPLATLQLVAAVHGPILLEATRRRRFLLDAARAIREAAPPGLVDAFARGDLAAMAAAVPAARDSPVVLQHLAFFMVEVARMELLLLSPDPFDENDDPGADLVDGCDSVVSAPGDSVLSVPSGAGSEGSDPSDASRPASPSASLSALSGSAPSATTSTLRQAYFDTASFRAALTASTAIACAARALVAAFSSSLAGSLYTSSACEAAAQAVWLLVVTLKRLHPFPDPRAADLRAGLAADVQSCLDLLDASGRAAHRRLRMHIDRLAASESEWLPSADLAGMRDALRTTAECPHVRGDPSNGGFCWQCAAAGRVPRGADPLAEAASGGRRPRKVAFAASVEVRSTYGREEYSRGMDGE